MAGGRRGVTRILAAFALAAAALCHAQALTPRERGEDFDALWKSIDAGYAYFDAPARAAWKRARSTWRPRAVKAESREAFVAALEGALAALREDHVDLSERSESAPRRVPYELDLWPVWRDGSAWIESVRTFGDADVAGLHPGEVVTRVDDVAIARAVRERLRGGSTDARASDWALRQVMAGPRRGTLRVDTMERANRATHTIEHGGGKRSNLPPVIEHRIGERRDLGYIRLRLGDDEPTGPPFERALSNLAGTRALIVDLRDTPAPSTRESTLEVLRHFVDREAPWQVRRPRHGPEAIDRVTAAGLRYRGPVVVLVDRWTAGEAEALAAGLVAVCGARIVGTASAGLRGELHEARLPHSGIVARFPGEKTLLVNGAPRETLRPDVAIDLAAPKGGPGDPILYEALKLLEKTGDRPPFPRK